MSGPPATALLLHSFGSAGRSWNEVRARLDMASLAPDLPGFGDAPPLPSPSVGAYADWVLARMAEIDGEVVLVGASMGGKIAMAAAARRPAGVRALVLCAPSPPTPEPMEEDERRRQLRSHGDVDAARKSVGQSTLASPESASFREGVQDWLRTDDSAWRWWWSEGSRENLDVTSVKAATQVLVGDADDHLGALVQARYTLPRIPGASLTVVKGASHLVAIDQPGAVAHAIRMAATISGSADPSSRQTSR